MVVIKVRCIRVIHISWNDNFLNVLKINRISALYVSKMSSGRKLSAWIFILTLIGISSIPPYSVSTMTNNLDG